MFERIKGLFSKEKNDGEKLTAVSRKKLRLEQQKANLERKKERTIFKLDDKIGFNQAKLAIIETEEELHSKGLERSISDLKEQYEKRLELERETANSKIEQNKNAHVEELEKVKREAETAIEGVKTELGKEINKLKQIIENQYNKLGYACSSISNAIEKIQNGSNFVSAPADTENPSAEDKYLMEACNILVDCRKNII